MQSVHSVNVRTRPAIRKGAIRIRAMSRARPDGLRSTPSDATGTPDACRRGQGSRRPGDAPRQAETNVPMEYIIQQLARTWGDALPKQEEFLYAEHLEQAGLPEMLRSWVVTLLEHQLQETLTPPMTEWADLDREETRAAWLAFRAAAARRVRLPRAYIPAVMQTALGDVLEQLLQPRVAIPQLLFGQESELPAETVRERSRRVLAHRRLADAVVRYMERQEADRLGREQCARIVARVDAAFLGRETPEQILGQIEPLFELFGHDAVDPSLLALFFGDKEMDAFANRLEELRTPVERRILLELLHEQMGREAAGEEVGKVDEASPARPTTPEFVEQPLPPRPEPTPEPEKELRGALPEQFPTTPAEPVESFPDQEVVSPPVHSEPVGTESLDSEPMSPEPPEPAGEQAERPIWQQFMPQEEDGEQEHLDRLRQWLRNDRDRFVEEVFGGAEDGFEVAVEELAAAADWFEASRYIQREVFDRNQVNMYAEAAIDFTDLLQSYFKEFKPS